MRLTPVLGRGRRECACGVDSRRCEGEQEALGPCIGDGHAAWPASGLGLRRGACVLTRTRGMIRAITPRLDVLTESQRLAARHDPSAEVELERLGLVESEGAFAHIAADVRFSLRLDEPPTGAGVEAPGRVPTSPNTD